MKTLLSLLALCGVVVVPCVAQQSSSSSVASGSKPVAPESLTSQFSIIEKGPHHRVWSRVEWETTSSGRRVPHVQSVTELATGLNVKDASGQWVESSEQVESVSGGAAATHGAHKAFFSNNLLDGVRLTTPEGKPLQTRIIGLAFYDTASGASVLIAQPKDSQGSIAHPNMVVYPDAFDDISATVRYTYTRSGFEQDVILTHRLEVKPEDYGMNSATTVLQMLTEIVPQEQPGKREHAMRFRSGLVVQNDDIDFGALKLSDGKAFSVSADGSRGDADVPTAKQWLKLDGRDVLVEQVSIPDIEPQLQALPAEQASISPTGRPRSVIASSKARGQGTLVASLSGILPKPRSAKAITGAMQTAALSKPLSGLVLDYNATVVSGTNFSFLGEYTYYVSGNVNLAGVTVIEGGTIIKFAASSSAKINIIGGIDCQTGPYRPAVLTSVNDLSLGYNYSGNGSPTNYDGGTYLCGATNSTYSYLRFCYAGTAVQPGNVASDFWHCQFFRCGRGVASSSTQTNVGLHNVLFTGCGYALTNAIGSGEHVTADGVGVFSAGGPASLTNSILTAVTNMANLTLAKCATSSSSSGFFQMALGGQYYLTPGSTNRSAGTTNISPKLLADLRSRTTYAPISFTNVTFTGPTNFVPQAPRETGYPDLGYAYDPLDYVFGGCTLGTNTLFPVGTAVGWFRTSSGYDGGVGLGMRLGSLGKVVFAGTPEKLNWFVRCNTVQEQDWTAMNGVGGIAGSAPDFATVGTVQLTSTHCSQMACDANHFRDDYYGCLAIQAKDCEIYNGANGGYNMYLNYTNSLFVGVNDLGLVGNNPTQIMLQNCTLRRGGLILNHRYGVNWRVSISDCVFDNVVITMNDYSGGDTNITYLANNAFLTNCSTTTPAGLNTITVTNFNWQTSWQGRYYLPIDSLLINAGSRTATLVGLSYYTTQSNQMWEGASPVDIGYHYAPVDPLGNPLIDGDGNPIDRDGDGVADYMDAEPFNPAMGVMKVTIETPSAGAVISR